MVVAVREPFVALPHIRVGNECWHRQRGERGEIRFAMVARVRRVHRRARAPRRKGLDDRK